MQPGCGCGMRMGMPGMPMGMPMSPMAPMAPMAAPMAMPMAMPMMGMPMMGMMGMPTMPMMAPMMMGMGMPGMGMTGAAGMPGAGMPGAGMPGAGMPGMAPQSMASQASKVAGSPGGDKPERSAPLSAGPIDRRDDSGHGDLSHRSDLEERDRRDDHPPRAKAGGEKADAPKDEGREKSPPRCHLHPAKKPNAKCKFCQRAQGKQEGGKASGEGGGPNSQKDKGGAHHDSSKKQELSEEIEEDYSRRTFNCSPMLKDQIYGSSYFKSLLAISSVEELIEEISKYADTLDVYNGGNTVMPSCFICQVYRLFTLPHAEDLDQLQAIIDHPTSANVRCAGFLYMRFVVNPLKLWEKLEEYLFDDMELKYSDSGKQISTTIGEYVETLLGKDKYFTTPLPRIPVKVRQALERELAPLPQYRKRMQAHQREFRGKRMAETPVEVYVEGSWVPGICKEYTGRLNLKRKVKVLLDDGTDVSVHLGKVVLREEEPDEKEESGAESGSEEGGKKSEEGEKAEKAEKSEKSEKEKKEKKKRKRSRSRSRRRGGSPDWSRFKGSGNDQTLVEALRERMKEEAVCGYGKAYARRPLTVEEELWKRDPDARVSMLGESERGGSGGHRSGRPSEKDSVRSEVAKKMKREEEEEHKRRMREIYEKYGSAKSAASMAAKKSSEIEEPDVLRLG